MSKYEATKQKRKFSSFFKSLVIELDKDLYGPDNHLVEVRGRIVHFSTVVLSALIYCPLDPICCRFCANCQLLKCLVLISVAPNSHNSGDRRISGEEARRCWGPLYCTAHAGLPGDDKHVLCTKYAIPNISLLILRNHQQVVPPHIDKCLYGMIFSLDFLFIQ